MSDIDKEHRQKRLNEKLEYLTESYRRLFENLRDDIELDLIEDIHVISEIQLSSVKESNMRPVKHVFGPWRRHEIVVQRRDL